jgi:hypothetical protein
VPVTFVAMVAHRSPQQLRSMLKVGVPQLQV